MKTVIRQTERQHNKKRPKGSVHPLKLVCSPLCHYYNQLNFIVQQTLRNSSQNSRKNRVKTQKLHFFNEKKIESYQRHELLKRHCLGLLDPIGTPTRPLSIDT